MKAFVFMFQESIVINLRKDRKIVDTYSQRVDENGGDYCATLSNIINAVISDYCVKEFIFTKPR